MLGARGINSEPGETQSEPLTTGHGDLRGKQRGETGVRNSSPSKESQTVAISTTHVTKRLDAGDQEAAP